MNKKFNSGLALILPSKRINLFVIFVIVLGIISGAIFLVALKDTDKELVTNQITTFISNIDGNNINNFVAFKNALWENIIFILLIWFLGMSIIGVILNIFFIYFKSFTVGFTLSSLFLVYEAKGLLAGFIYLFPSCIINILVMLIIGVYSIILTIKLWKTVFMKDRSYSISKFLRKYVVILVISLILTVISAGLEGYLFPAILKLAIKLFI